MNKPSLLIIGGGAAGMAAALSAKAAGKEVLLVERSSRLGGVLPQCLHHGFGLSYFGEDLTGAEYARRFVRLVKEAEIKMLLGTTVMELTAEKTALLASCAGFEQISFDQAILASGCREKPLGALPICGSRPAGIFTAGQAQQMVNINRYDLGEDIIILGSGDIGLIMARELKQLGKNIVAIIEQKPALDPLSLHQHIPGEFNIPLLTSSVIKEIHGDKRISGVSVCHLHSNQRKYLPCSTLLISVGLLPERELVDPLLQGDNLPEWLSLCGNCDYVHRIVDTVSMQGYKLGAI